MNGPNDRDAMAIDALRRLDRPHDPDPASLRRIETTMLDHFDAVVRSGSAAAGDGLVELLRDDAPPPRRRRAPWIVLAAAAVAAVLGAVVLLRSGAADVDVPSTQPPTPTAPAGETRLTDQLQAYCVQYVGPLVDASALWSPNGLASEQRSDVLVAIEQAAQGLVDLGPPAATAFGSRDLTLLDLATSARRADALRSGGDDTVQEARDAILEELATNPATARLEECAAD